MFSAVTAGASKPELEVVGAVDDGAVVDGVLGVEGVDGVVFGVVVVPPLDGAVVQLGGVPTCPAGQLPGEKLTVDPEKAGLVYAQSKAAFAAVIGTALEPEYGKALNVMFAIRAS